MGEERGRARFSIPISVNTQRWNTALPSLFANQYYTHTWGEKKDWVKEHYIFNLDTVPNILWKSYKGHLGYVFIVTRISLKA